MAQDDIRETKQVIVMRTDLNMRKGKMVAQGAHASIAFLTKRLRTVDIDKQFEQATGEKLPDSHWTKPVRFLTLSQAEDEWNNSSYKKICVGVDSEEDLLQIYAKALSSGIEAHIITDSGLTEFGGVPTRTCAAIGPWWSDELDEITGGLKLL